MKSIICPKCKAVIEYNPYFSAYVCQYCGYDSRKDAEKRPTNFDRITASPEALAKAFANGCPREDWHCKGRSCERCWFDYLNSPAESEEV